MKDRIKLFTHLNEIAAQVTVGMYQDLSESCKWPHEKLEFLPIFKYPFDLRLFPKNGVLWRA